MSDFGKVEPSMRASEDRDTPMGASGPPGSAFTGGTGSRAPSRGPSRAVSRVPSYDDLPDVDDSLVGVELANVTVEDTPEFAHVEHTEIHVVYQEQKQEFDEKLHKDGLSVVADEDHLLSVAAIADRYKVSVDLGNILESKGLEEDDAKERLERHGPNSLTPPAKVPEWKKFIREFTGIFAIMLELAGIGCFVNYALQGAPENLFLGVILWIVVILSGGLNYYQTRKSSRVMGSFGSLVPPRCIVLRGGAFKTIPAEELVPGDIMRFKGGDKIPADMRLISASGVKVDNSSLTGESDALSRCVDTDEPSPFEAANLVFMGTLCLEGEALGLVTSTGDNTVLGKTARLASQTTTELTVLQKEIQKFVKVISIVGIAVGIIVIIISVSLKVYWLDSFVFGVGSIVAIVPEGLQLTVTLALTLTAGRMARNNVMVKKLSIVETLGCTSVICSDKTGTLTQNNMTVSYIVYDNSIHQANSLTFTASKIDAEDPHYVTLSKSALLCNRAFFDPADPNGKQIIGDASETALLRYAATVYNVDKMRQDYPKVVEIPFNSLNKWQLSIHKTASNPTAPFILLLKGAPERVLSKCSTAYFGNEVLPLDEKVRAQLEAIIAELGAIGQRVLGFARLQLDPTEYPPDYQFDVGSMNFPTDGLTFTGFFSIYDPPRDKVDEAVRVCQEAGIKVVMVTGDHPATAKAIAKQIGIIKGKTPDELMKEPDNNLTEDEAKREAPAIVIAGNMLDSFTEDDWEIVTSKQEIVFARTSPEQKLQIVSQFQAKGEIVAVTGDGVNDSPALKRADVGVAMGITGSAVAKEAADIVLMDDNFVTIVHAVEEGRLIFDNLKKSIAYALSAKIPEVFPFLSFIILGLPLPLSTVLVLCIDIGTDLIPGISLAYEKAETTLMKRRPRIPSKHKLVSRKLIFFSLIQIGTIQAISGFTSYFLSMHRNGFPARSLFFTSREYFLHNAPDYVVDGVTYDAAHQMHALRQAQTAFFCSIIMTQLADNIICKTRFLSFFQQRSRNMVQLVGLCIAVLVAVLFAYVPGVETVLGTSPIGGVDWAIMLPFSVFIVCQDELRKYFIRKNPQGLVSKYTYW